MQNGFFFIIVIKDLSILFFVNTEYKHICPHNGVLHTIPNLNWPHSGEIFLIITYKPKVNLISQIDRLLSFIINAEY